MSSKYEFNFKVTPKQAQCLKYLMDKVTTEVGYGGAAGGGKSWLGVGFCVMMARAYPGTRWFIGRKELTTLTKSTLQTFYDILDFYGVPESMRGKMDGKNNIITFWNGSQIFLLDLAYKPTDPKFHRLGSTEFTGGFVDEAAEVNQQAITILKTRIGRQKNDIYGLKPKILLTFNPDKGYVYADFYRPYRDKTLPPYRVFIPALATDNKHLDASYIEQLEHSDEVTRQRLLFGNFEYDDTPGKIFRTDEILDLFTNIIKPSNTHYISADVARLGDDKTIITVRKGLEVVQFVRMEKKTTDVIAQKIKELEREYKVERQHIVIDTDGVGGGVADQLRGCYQFHNNASPIKTEVEGNYGNLKAQCYFLLKLLAEKRLIRINTSGEIKDEICLELENILKKNPDKDGKIYLESKEDMKKRLGDKSPDIADSIMMRMIFELNQSSEIRQYEALYDNYE